MSMKQQSRRRAMNNDQEEDAVMPGFRFHPTEEELIEFYLRRKVEGKRFGIELIASVDLYRYDPWELPALAAAGEKEWYFYVPRDRKYRNGDRPNRVTTSGYWKATGADRIIRGENLKSNIGLKKTLVFYTGKAPKGIRTNWIMNEYRLPQNETERLQKAEISLCRVHKRASLSRPARNEAVSVAIPKDIIQGNCGGRMQQVIVSETMSQCSSNDVGSIFPASSSDAVDELHKLVMSNYSQQPAATHESHHRHQYDLLTSHFSGSPLPAMVAAPASLIPERLMWEWDGADQD